MMKKGMRYWTSTMALGIGGVLLVAYAVVSLSPVEAQDFGNTEVAVIRIMDQDPRAFFKALKETVLLLPAQYRQPFRDTLKAKLGLGNFAANLPADMVYKLRRWKPILDSMAANSDAIFAEILQTIEPIREGEGEG